MASTFQHGNLSFLYPENWLLSEVDSGDESSLQVMLESPTGGMWMLSATPAATNAAAAIDEAVDAINAQFEDVEWSEVKQPFYGFEAVGADGFFYSLDLLICAQIRSFKTLDRTIVVVIQSESRDFDKTSPVYDAITLSLLKSLSHTG